MLEGTTGSFALRSSIQEDLYLHSWLKRINVGMGGVAYCNCDGDAGCHSDKDQGVGTDKQFLLGVCQWHQRATERGGGEGCPRPGDRRCPSQHEQ